MLWVIIIAVCSFGILLIGWWMDKCKQLQLAEKSNDNGKTTELDSFIQTRTITESGNIVNTNV
nr:unnamed protein product [Callosobruchus analis]